MLYKDIKQLQTKCNAYFKETKLVAPRAFRVYLGVSKHLLSTWKESKPNYFNLIKLYEDQILSKLEEYAIYGATHPDIRKCYTKKQTTKAGTTTETKFNQVGAIFTLRAYDKNLYIPEQEHIQLEKQQEEKIIIKMEDNSKKTLKGLEAKVNEKSK